jgi:hypothetical protein
MARGDVFVITVTFPEGLTIAEMAKIFESHGLGSASSFVKASRDVQSIHELDAAATDLEGYLFPETYALPRHADAERLVHLMTARFVHTFGTDLREAAAAQHLTVRQAVTLASIVEKETKPRWPLGPPGTPIGCDGHGVRSTVITRSTRREARNCGVTTIDSATTTPPGLRPVHRRVAPALEAAVHPPTGLPLFRVTQRRHARVREPSTNTIATWCIGAYSEIEGGKGGEGGRQEGGDWQDCGNGSKGGNEKR